MSLSLRSSLRAATAAFALAVLLAPAACTKHGAFTSQAIEDSNKRLAALKSGVEWQQAQEQFLAGDLHKASRSIENAIALSPTTAKSHVLRGRIMIERGELESARASLLRAEELEPDNVEAQYYLGIVHERFSQTDEAALRYQRASKLEPSNAQYVVAYAEMLVQLGRADDAERLLAQPHPALTHNAAIRQTAGHVALLLNKPADAVNLLKQARLLAPDDPSVLEDLVRAQMANRDYADAEFNISVLLRNESAIGRHAPGKHAARSASSDPDMARRDLLHWQAECLTALNRLTEARAVLDRLVADDSSTAGTLGGGSSDLRAWIALGNVAAALNDQARLRRAAHRVTALAPTRPDGYLMRAMHLRGAGDLAAALSAVDTAIALDENAAAPRSLRDLILRDLGAKSDADLSHASRNPGEL